MKKRDKSDFICKVLAEKELLKNHSNLEYWTHQNDNSIEGLEVANYYMDFMKTELRKQDVKNF